MLRKAWQRIQAVLEADESVVAWFEPDLDDKFHYASGLVVFTNRRLLSVEPVPTQANGKPVEPDLRSWPIAQVTALRSRDRAGSGILEAESAGERLAWWRYTVSRAGEVHKLVERFLAFQRGEGVGSEEEQEDIDELIGARKHKASRVRASALFRLLRFARARSGLITLGFILTLASTVAGLVPTYLTGPLMDNILVPYQNDRTNIENEHAAPEQLASQLAELQQRERERFMTVGWYLLALGGAAALAWLLAWFQGVVMAYVSERISADLRNQT